jgi:hypothetical protein
LNPDNYSASAFHVRPEDLLGTGDIRVGALTVDVVLHDLSEALRRFIVAQANDTSTQRDLTLPELRDAFEVLGLRVQKGALTAVNRLLTFARVLKGQFWVKPAVYDDDNQAGFRTATNASVSVDDGPWIRWNPSCIGALKVTLPPLGERRISDNDWSRAQAFLTSASAPPLHLELLAAAEALEDDDHARVALMEAVAALEVMISRFFKVNAAALEPTLIADLDVKSYEALRTKLGLRGTLAVLLPLVVARKELPLDVLRATIKAVEVRGTVVHGGNRKLSQSDVVPMLHSIRKTIEALHGLTERGVAA